ncbi:DUF6894 family protein [Bradyrhizobium japonicum]|uniref:DUF6894 family protein n=1 Tax=Bradyrhizobium japonicum TaxID=375 RepID=UPI001FCC9783|nr:hypothetical protein [Bradyrhizobium japonicum]
MAEQAAKLKEQASQLPAGPEREALLKRARIAETGAHLSDWLTSSGMRQPDPSWVDREEHGPAVKHFSGMPRYFFHITHERTEIDDVGEELPDKHAAWKECHSHGPADASGHRRKAEAGARLAYGSDGRVSEHALRPAHPS